MSEFHQGFILADLVSPLFDFLHIRIDHFWMSGTWISISSPGFFEAGPWTPNSAFLNPRVLILFFTCVPFPQDPEGCHLTVTAAKAAQTFTCPTRSSLFLSLRSSRVPPLISSSINVSGSCHQCTSETSWIACTLLCWPSSTHEGGQVSHEDQSLKMSGFYSCL